ncbi:MAG TPA: TetR/AcrR family transcriptional regulator [Candidatus Aminicenantes bacterium]|nr:TetR/AcrR family transcriptional regulator [Candidatus Aminicenantes bacterium]HRY63759.1 TetR/AcrR family transcriptional regulator [Candidatus Aminicenantes bacterium]HRZ70672.1 TetR/AcrR family transcriptional regulator [Candidatus Aminicenantes bacterium]
MTEKENLVRADILRAAEAVFQRWGVTKTTMEDIARQAGKAKSTLYYHFENKDDVLDAMAQVKLLRIVDQARVVIAGKTTAKEQLLAYILTIFREVRESMAPLNLERDLASIRAVVDRIVGKFDAMNEKVVETILRSGLERGEFRSIGSGDLPITTLAIGAVIKSLTFNLFIDSRDKRLIDPIIRLMSEGL